MKTAIASTLAILLGVLVWTAAPVSAKGSKDPCKRADIKLARTGQGDSDGDGISDCRESKILRTAMDDPAVRQRIEDVGVSVVAGTPEQYAAEINAEYTLLKRVVDERKLTLDGNP